MKNYYLRNVLILSFCITLITQNGFSQDFNDSIPENLKTHTTKGQSSFLVKVAVEALLNKYDYVKSKPPFFDASFKYQYKIGFYEFGVGPGVWYCPGNDYLKNGLYGVFSLANNFYISEKGKTSSIIFAEIGTRFLWHDFDDGYTSSYFYGEPLITLGIALKFGNKKKSTIEIGFRESFCGFFEEWDQSFIHVGIGYTF